jgi:signal transduction histidine kinase
MNFEQKKRPRMKHPLFFFTGLFLLPSLICSFFFQNKIASADVTSPKQRVLLLHSYHHGFTWSDKITEGVRSAFLEYSGDVELLFEFMDTRRIATGDYFAALKQLYRVKYQDKKIDVLICSDDHALNFTLGADKDLFPDTPIVFCSVSGFVPAMRKNRELTGLQENIDILKTLKIALQLHPNTTQVAVITDHTRTGRALKEKAYRVFRDYEERLRFTYLEELTIEELTGAVSQLPDDTIVFLFIFSRDKAGRVFSHEENLRILSKHCRVPIYAVWEFYLGRGIVGGMLTSGHAEGREVGEIAIRILRGEKASDIPLAISPTQYKFDYRQLERFGINMSALPAGSIVIEKPFSFYQTYKRLIWTVVSIILGLTAIVIALIGNLVYRRRAQLALQAYREHLEKLVEERTSKLESAQEALIQKERLAVLGQITATVAHEIRNPLGTVRTSIFSIEDAMEQHQFNRVARALKLAERNINRCDEIISELLGFSRPRALKPEPMDVDTWLKSLMAEQDIPEGMTCQCHFGAGIVLSFDKESLRRAFINVITNAVQALEDDQSQDHHLTVETKIVNNRLEIRVADNGPGIAEDLRDKIFEPLFSTKGFGVGLGLSIVKDIMENHGGGVEISTELGKGTTVCLWLPILDTKEEER